ncbi:MAG TPA: hypothetical protein ENN34_09840 [Deltaproteobacteria bacterium]|nr:hypothetical protein [Deltaproteobacteria bacterium]
MPQRLWKHTCRDGRTVWSGSPDRCTCGAEGEFDGWYNGMLDLMAWYQKLYGLKPIGPHRLLADRVLHNATCRCPECSGRGYHDLGQGKAFRTCLSCGGAGKKIVVSAEHLSTLRATILEEYPEAAAPYNIPNPATGVVIQDLQKGEMIMVTEEDPT